MTENPKTDPKASEEQGMVKCPCCGKFTLPKQLKPSDNLMDQWISCMMTATPFSHTYPVYDGRLNVTAVQLSTEDATTAQNLVTLLRYIKSLDWQAAGYNGCPTSIDQMINNAYLYISILEIRIKGKGNEVTVKPSTAVKEAATVLLSKADDIRAGKPFTEWVDAFYKCERLLVDPSNISSVPQSIIMGVAEAHARISTVLMDAGFNDNFWDGIELA